MAASASAAASVGAMMALLGSIGGDVYPALRALCLFRAAPRWGVVSDKVCGRCSRIAGASPSEQRGVACGVERVPYSENSCRQQTCNCDVMCSSDSDVALLLGYVYL